MKEEATTTLWEELAEKRKMNLNSILLGKVSIKIKITGSVIAGLLLSELDDLVSQKGSDEISEQDLLQKTLLSPEEFKIAKGILCEKGFIKNKEGDIYYVDYEKVYNAMENVEEEGVKKTTVNYKRVGDNKTYKFV